jgi:hypothetical protein
MHANPCLNIHPPEFYKKFNRLLTLDDLLKVAEIPEEDGDELRKAISILVWYFDSWLPACAGIEHYSPNVRYYKRAVSGKEVAPNRKVAYVPIAAEAFGRIILENCEEKWQHIIPKKAANANWKMPADNKNDPNKHKYYVTKWSDGSTGQVLNGGWKAEAVEKFGEHTQSIQEFRKEDKKKDKALSFYVGGLNAMRGWHKIQGDAPPTSSKRKRAPSLEKKVAMKKLPKVRDCFSDEEEDDFSMHSEIDGNEDEKDDAEDDLD